jgi:hypothetical protein
VAFELDLSLNFGTLRITLSFNLEQKSYTYMPVSSTSPVLMNAIGTAMPVFNNMYHHMNETIDNNMPAADTLIHSK